MARFHAPLYTASMKCNFLGDTAIVVMQRGERLSSCVTALLGNEGMKECGTIVTGLGLVKNIDIGYGYYEDGEVGYERKTLQDPLELLSLSGFILKSARWPFHLHASLGGKGLAVLGGHLFDCEIATFIEMTILMSDVALTRTVKDGLPELEFPSRTREGPGLES